MKIPYLFIVLITFFTLTFAVHAEDEIVPTPAIHTLSITTLAVPSAQPFQKTIALYGTELDQILFGDQVTVQFGPFIAERVSGNAEGINAVFTIDPILLVHRQSYTVSVYQNQTRWIDGPSIQVSYPSQRAYRNKQTRKYLSRVKTTKLTKQTIGLNVHRTLGATTTEEAALFDRRLQGTQTVWVREHIAFDLVMGSNQVAWLERYDETIRTYKQQGKRVQMMLAYGKGPDPHAPPPTKEWKTFVKLVVKRYRNDVDAWEIWNEPDSGDYLHPNTVDALLPLQKVGYKTIKHYAPNTVVLNGPIADIRNTEFVSELYKKAGKYFDALSVHLYYCDELQADGNLDRLAADWQRLLEAIPERRRSEKIWITELGCSLGLEGVTEQFQRKYLKMASKQLLKTNTVQNIFLYTIRDRSFLAETNQYEAYFGLLNAEGKPRIAWHWYRMLPFKVKHKVSPKD